MFWILALLTSFSAITMVFAGSLSILRNSKKEEHRWFFFLALCLAIWIFVNFLGSNLAIPGVTELFVKLDFSFALISSWLFLQFVAALVSNHPFYAKKKHFTARHKYFKATTLALLVLVCGAIASGSVFDATLNAHGLDVKTRGLFWVYVLYIAFLAFHAIGILVGAWRKIAKKNREGLDMILVGFAIFIVANMASNLLFPYWFQNREVVEQLNIIGYLGVMALVICIYLAMTFNKLFDIRLGVFRSATYLFSTMLIGLVYIAPMVYVIGIVVFNLKFSWPKFLAVVILATIIANSYVLMKRWFDGITKKIFFRDSYNPSALLGELNRLLVSSVELNNMLEKSSDLIVRNLRVESCMFVLMATANAPMRVIGSGGTDRKMSLPALRPIINAASSVPGNVIEADYLTNDLSHLGASMAKNDVAVAIRLTPEARKDAVQSGFMLLGFKKNGNPYNSQDLQALEAIGDVMVIAIQNALQFEEIQQFNMTLQQRVTEATSKLRRNNAKLRALDETKDDFISMASHQLRTPLTSVKGYLSMVLEGDAGTLTPLQHKMLDQAFVSSQRMVFLIADLLNVSRLKTGKFLIEPSRVNLAKTVADEVSQLKETAKGRSLQLVYERPAEFPTLMIDETKIRQVIMNFIDNAIYYTPAGGTITIDLLDRPDTVELRVSDTGIGVPRTEQPHLFTKFYRAGNARQTRPDGTGLGLFMAKKVIIAQGGAVIFESREGKGSTFGFVFSKSKLALPAQPNTAPAGVVHAGLQR